MSRFEFLMMIASVVVAIGMTEIAGGWGKMVRTPAQVNFDWLHLGWTIYILLLAVQYWVGMWSYNQLEISYVGQIYFFSDTNYLFSHSCLRDNARHTP